MNEMGSQAVWRTVAYYALAAVLPLAVIAGWEGARDIDWGIPLSYEWDALVYLTLSKTLLDGDWTLYLGIRSGQLGAPVGFDFRDFPVPDNFVLGIVRLIGVFVGDVFRAVNAYFVLTYSLCSLSFAYMASRVGIRPLAALVCGLLFAFLPYHVLVNIGHLHQTSYFLLPLFVVVVHDIHCRAAGEGAGASVRWFGQTRRSMLGLLLFGVLLGSAGAYFAFWSVLLLCVMASSDLLFGGSGRASRIRASAAVCGAIGVTLILNVLPSILYWASHGRNPVTAARSPIESEAYALKLTHLVLPHWSGFEILNRMAAQYWDALPNQPHGPTYLGLVGALGFLGLLVVLGRRRNVGTLVDRLAQLNVAAFLFATVGGLGVLFAATVTSQFRVWSRLSVLIGLFALTFVAAELSRIVTRNRRAWLYVPLCVLVAVIGVYDQRYPNSFDFPDSIDSAEIRSGFESDRAFVDHIESDYPGARIFQLPFIETPEARHLHDLSPYTHFRVALHSHSLSWSHGAMKGRDDAWHRRVTGLEPDAFLASIAEKEFSGVALDRRGFEDRGRSLAHALEARLGAPVLESQDGNLLYFAIDPHASLPDVATPPRVNELR